MKGITAFEVDKHIESGKMAGVYMLYGSESMLISDSKEKLERAMMPELSDLNFVRLDGADCSLDRLEDELSLLPQFSTHRLISICDFSVTELSDKEMDRLCSAIADIGSDCCLIMWYLTVEVNSSEKWKRLQRVVRENGCYVDCGAPNKNDMPRRLCQYAEENGIRMREQEARYLISLSGSDYSRLMGQMDTLIAVAQKKTITTELIDKFIDPGIEANIYHLANNILTGNFDKAYDILERLFLQRQEPDYILRTLQGPFIDLYRAKSAQQAGLKLEQVKEKYPGDYPDSRSFRIENAMRDCGRYSFALLRRYIDLIASAACGLHSSKIDEKVMLERLLAQLCNARREEGKR